jgi:hypothetical protein
VRLAAKVTAALKHHHRICAGSVARIERLWRTVKEDCFFVKSSVEIPPPDGAQSAEILKVSTLAHLLSIFSHIVLTF